jgi:integrase/recombinase XerD
LPAKLITTIKNIGIKVENETNRQLLKEFYEYLTRIDTSENYQNGLIKVLIRFAEHLGKSTTFYQVQDKEKIIQFLDLKRKKDLEDPDKKWITTWNDYLWRIKYFYRWLSNTKDNEMDTAYHDN